MVAQQAARSGVAGLPNDDISMPQVYGGANSAGQYDAVLTCFFLDTAHNVLVRCRIGHRFSSAMHSLPPLASDSTAFTVMGTVALGGTDS